MDSATKVDHGCDDRDITEKNSENRSLDKNSCLLQLTSCDITKLPVCVARYAANLSDSSSSLIRGYNELSSKSKLSVKPRWYPKMANNNYFRGVKWAPDGSCLMTNSNDHTIRIFNTPQSLLDSSDLKQDANNICSEDLSAILTIKENSIIYDYIWNTNMDSSDATTCYLLTTGQNSPIHLWSAYDSSLQSTYSVKSQSDELISIHSLALAGFLSTKILAGYKRNIAIVDIDRPGIYSPDKKSHSSVECQHGIISCITTNSIDYNLYAAGSYSRQIGIYDLRQTIEPQCLMTGQKGGLTHLKFSSDGRHLFSCGRKDQEILCWDMRNLGVVLEVFKTDSYTNQTLYFDISQDGKFISSGDTKGNIRIWDLARRLNNQSLSDSTSKSTNDIFEDLIFEAHTDCVNGVSFHPYLPILTSVSGQRHLLCDMSDLSDDEFYDGSEPGYSTRSRLKYSTSINVFNNKQRETKVDNSIKLWRI